MDKNQIIEKLKIDVNKKIIEALKKMDMLKYKLLIVTDHNKYHRLLSIGDIQRAVIKGYDLNSPIQNILRSGKKIRIAREKDRFDDVKKTMLKYKIDFMPIIDEENRIRDVLFWEEVIPEEMPNADENIDIPVVIMAGGEGTRLRPITNIIPKALIPLREKPIIQVIMENFASYGMNKFFVSVNHKQEMIRQYFSSQESVGFDIEYIEEDIPLGTAGSLHLLKENLSTTFFVSNCDIIVDQNFVEVYRYHKDNKNEMTIISALKNYHIPYGTITTSKGGILKSIAEKPDLTFQVNTGVYILEPHLLDEIPANKRFDITFLIENIKKRKGIVGVFPVSENSWIDIGDWTEYRNALDLADNKEKA